MSQEKRFQSLVDSLIKNPTERQLEEMQIWWHGLTSAEKKSITFPLNDGSPTPRTKDETHVIDYQELIHRDEEKPYSKFEKEVIEAISVKRDMEGFINCSDFLDCLSEKDRDIVELRIQGYTQSEIAGEIGMSHQAISKRLSHIRLKLDNFLSL